MCSVRGWPQWTTSAADAHGYSNLDLARLYGETMLPTAAYFNGVEPAEDKPLTTSASWLNNCQFTALYRQALVAKAAGA